MIIVLLLLFQSLCLYCQRLVLHIHDRCFPRNARLLQEVAETVGDRKALQHLEHLEVEQHKRRQKRRILEPILPLGGAGLNLEACRFCAHSPQGYCRHHFHLQVHRQSLNETKSGEQDYKQLRRIRRELKRSLEQQQQQLQQSRSVYRSYQSYQQQQQQQDQEQPYHSQSTSLSSLSSGYGSLALSLENTPQEQGNQLAALEIEQEELQREQRNQQPEQLAELTTSHL